MFVPFLCCQHLFVDMDVEPDSNTPTDVLMIFI